jgi:hypothetical protein
MYFAYGCKTERFILREENMKITVKELQITGRTTESWYIGPTFAYCNNPDMPSYGSLIMNVMKGFIK